MSTIATRSIVYAFTGDVNASKTEAAGNNSASSGDIYVQYLVSGNNAITPPATPFVPRAVTLVFLPGNTTLVTLKGDNGDTGIPLHRTDPTSIGLDGGTTPFVLHTMAPVQVRMIWH